MDPACSSTVCVTQFKSDLEKLAVAQPIKKLLLMYQPACPKQSERSSHQHIPFVYNPF
jgi:hypothetical protein